MRKAVSFGLAAALLAVGSSAARAQPTLTVDLAAATGGDTNDVQLAYGGGLEFWRSGSLHGGLDFVYVRDFFEFEPDSPLDDAQVYTDVVGAFASVRWVVTDRGVRPYLLAAPGWLRSRALGRESDHLGIQLGGGIGLWTDHRLGMRIETRYVAALTGSGSEPPDERISFWRTGISMTIALGSRDQDRGSRGASAGRDGSHGHGGISRWRSRE